MNRIYYWIYTIEGVSAGHRIIMNIKDIKFITTDWNSHIEQLKKIRDVVFIKEQNVPAELEWDEFDPQSTHFLALHSNQAIATARLKPDGQIGRMAVIKDYRNKGIGSQLLTNVLCEAGTRGYSMIYLHAQKNSIYFYEKFNFIRNGGGFMDAGIPHQAMYKLLQQ